MKLWLLRPRPEFLADPAPKIAGTVVKDEDQPYNPWDPWYDKAFGYVVRAESQEQARKLAVSDGWSSETQGWWSDKYSTCEELTATGEPEVIIRDFHAA